MGNTCECGCNKFPNKGKRFILGHHNKGTHFTKEHRRKISISNSKTHTGKILSKVHKKNISIGNTGKKRTPEQKRNISESLKGHYVSEQAKKKMRDSHLGQVPDIKGKHHSKKIRKRLSEIGKEKWRDPKYREKQLKTIFAGHNTSPNKPERRVRNGLNKMFPGEYKFVGDGQVFIGGRSPDFINVNGQKKIIEMFGDFWHGEKYRLLAFGDKLSNKEHENQRIKHFAKYGFKTLIVWQKELKNIPKLKRKLLKFHKQIS